MPLIYITGISGVGKSTIKDELITRGYEAHDTDENGLTTWVNKKTGQKAARPDDPEERNKEFLENHDWIMDRQTVEKLRLRSENKNIFLCGLTSNSSELQDLFDKCICLTIDEQTLKQRLASRKTNDFGKVKDELNSILSWHKLIEAKNKAAGAIMIDATQPIEVIVRQIIEAVED